MEQSYRDYLKAEVRKRKDEIEGLRNTYDIHKNYSKKVLDELKNGNRDFAEVITQLEKQVGIDRKYVASLYTKDETLYEAMVTTLFWGNLNMKNLLSVKDCSKEKVVASLKEVRKMIAVGQFGKAFEYMQGDGNIKGIGISFFTKILYFSGYNKEGVMPLIYDKWTQCVHAALLLPDKESFHLKSKNGNLEAPSFKHAKEASQLYVEYLQTMNKLSIEFGLSRPDRLEEFVFGYSKKVKSEWNETNPRYCLVKILSPYCSEVEEKPKEKKQKPSEETVVQDPKQIVQPFAEQWKQKYSNSKIDTRGKIIKSSQITARIRIDGREYNLIVGQDNRKSYYEIRPVRKEELPNVSAEYGLIDRGGKNPYLIKELGKTELKHACEVMGEILEKYHL